MSIVTDAGKIPVAIRILGKFGRLELDWPDGQVTGVTHAVLRNNCRCGECVAQRHAHGGISVVPEIRLVDVAPYGANAVRLTFSDGHGRGIYPFTWLQSLSAQG